MKCPRCGGGPVFTVLRKANKKRLHCHICEYKWWSDDPYKEKMPKSKVARIGGAQ